MWGQPPSPALSGAEGAVRRAKPGCISTTYPGNQPTMPGPCAVPAFFPPLFRVPPVNPN